MIGEPRGIAEQSARRRGVCGCGFQMTWIPFASQAAAGLGKAPQSTVLLRDAFEIPEPCNSSCVMPAGFMELRAISNELSNWVQLKLWRGCVGEKEGS
jgi:hypothetical protein